tara:strand:- start:10113 stop:11339 length:1227 start_codon:yes stop_codon:yes gene_type:complete
MSKTGIIRDGSITVDKPIKIEFINKITTTVNTIKLHYTTGVFGGNNNSEVLILLVNPDVTAYTSEYIRERVLLWISDGLASSSVLTLNDYLGDLVVTQVGVVGNQSTAQIIAAADVATACAATPNVDVAIDSTGAPLLGTGIYLVDGGGVPTGPVAAGNYALLLNSSKYFITVNSVSNISFIEVCPILLDFVYNLQNLTNPVTEPNTDAISFTMFGMVPGGPPGTTSYEQYYTYGPGAQSDLPDFLACDPVSNEQIYGSGNAMWPVGIVNNATTNVPNFAVEDVAFGVVLADPNVADFSNAQLYISFDLNANAGVVDDATFVPFQLQFGADPAFLGSPGGGVPGLCDGTATLTPGNTTPNLADVFTQSVWFPAGQSLQGTANFTDGSFCQWDKNTGLVLFASNPNCLS